MLQELKFPEFHFSVALFQQLLIIIAVWDLLYSNKELNLMMFVPCLESVRELIIKEQTSSRSIGIKKGTHLGLELSDSIQSPGSFLNHKERIGETY